MSPHTTLNRPGTRHTVFTVETREREGTGTNGNEVHTQQKKAATLHHAEMCFKATTEKTESMRRALLSLTAFYKKRMCWLYYFILALWMHLSIILNKLLLFTKGRSSSETQGQIVGARESLNGWEKMARRKVKNGEESARGQSFTRPVPNGRGHSGFWLVQETFVFFCPIRGQQTLESFLCVLTCKVHEGVSRSPCLSWLFAEALHKEVKRFNVRTKSKGKRSWISTIISPVNALDLSQVSTLFENQSKLSKCLMNTSVRKHSKSRRFSLYVVPWCR